MGWGQMLSLTIDSKGENLVKFYSSSEAGSSPVQSTVLRGQVLNIQGQDAGHMDPLLILVLQADPSGRGCRSTDSQQDSVV